MTMILALFLMVGKGIGNILGTGPKASAATISTQFELSFNMLSQLLLGLLEIRNG